MFRSIFLDCFSFEVKLVIWSFDCCCVFVKVIRLVRVVMMGFGGLVVFVIGLWVVILIVVNVFVLCFVGCFVFVMVSFKLV